MTNVTRIARGREVKVRDIIAPIHKKRTGICEPCGTRYTWHAENCPKIKYAMCPKCGGTLRSSGRHLPTYSLDGVMFDDGVHLQMFTLWGGYAE